METNSQPNASRVWCAACILVWLLVLSCGIQASASDASGAGLVWPPPPDEPRIAYVQTISKPSDAGAKVSGFRRFSNWVSGAQQGDEPLSRPFGLALDDLGNLCQIGRAHV